MSDLIERIKNVFILILCLLAVLVRGASKKKAEKPEKILIIQAAKLGDMVCTTPMFRAVKRVYPKAQVTVVGNKINRELLAGNPDVDDYIVWDRGDSLFSRVREIRKRQFDFGCVTGQNFEGLAALFLAGTPLIAAPKIENGRSPYETRPYRVLRKFVVVKSHRMGHYAPREYLRLLEPLGIKNADTTKHLYFSAAAAQQAEQWLVANGAARPQGRVLVGIAPGVGNKIKLWGSDKFARLTEFIYQDYQPVIVILGGKDDLAETNTLAVALSGRVPFLNAAGQFNLDEFKALVSRLSCLIAVDSGPIYIAEAFKTPTIDIVGPMDEREQPPQSPKHKVVIAERSAPVTHIMNARPTDAAGVQEARRQVGAITVEMVKRAFDESYPLLLNENL